MLIAPRKYTQGRRKGEEMKEMNQEMLNKKMGSIFTDLTCLVMELLSDDGIRPDLNELLDSVIFPTKTAFLSSLATFLGQKK